jgi:putative thioredoxin
VVEVSEATFPQIVELSMRVPVVVELYAPGLAPALGPVVESYGGRLVLATVDAQANPGIAEAFQVREVPAVAGVIGGRPVPLFVGTPPEEQVRQVFDQLLQVAAQNGVTGALDPNLAPDAEPAEPTEEPLPPLHQEAFDAISAGDYAGAVAAYRKAIAQNPRDALAVAGLAQASLLQRLDGAVADELRKAAADAPASVAAQLAVADLDVSGGHLDDAFDRLLDLFPSLDSDGREAVRTRLLEYFEIAGSDDPRVAAARRRLTLLLY